MWPRLGKSHLGHAWDNRLLASGESTSSPNLNSLLKDLLSTPMSNNEQPSTRDPSNTPMPDDGQPNPREASHTSIPPEQRPPVNITREADGMRYTDNDGVEHYIHIPQGQLKQACEHFINKDWAALARFPLKSRLH